MKTFLIITGILIAIVLAKPTIWSITAGGIIVIIGELIRIWATGHLKRNQEVTTSGPYAYLRDPLYLGRLFLLTGFCLMAWGYTIYLLPVGLGIFALNYMPRKYKKEMARLEKLFGEEYKSYAAYCRSLLPRLSPYPNAKKNNWSFTTLWQENREQYFILIVLAIFIAIIFRL
jgi:protein-S-isoprenylcysteine O-methyltransferase Ste14